MGQMGVGSRATTKATATLDSQILGRNTGCKLHHSLLRGSDSSCAAEDDQRSDARLRCRAPIRAQYTMQRMSSASPLALEA